MRRFGAALLRGIAARQLSAERALQQHVDSIALAGGAGGIRRCAVQDVQPFGSGCGLGVQNGPLGTKWLLEGDDVFEIALPNFVAGTCPASTTPLYRLWNNRSDSNHRYTTDLATKQLMISKGYVAEGYGPDAVVMCAQMQ